MSTCHPDIQKNFEEIAISALNTSAELCDTESEFRRGILRSDRQIDRLFIAEKHTQLIYMLQE